jgi:hypothetical protein
VGWNGYTAINEAVEAKAPVASHQGMRPLVVGRREVRLYPVAIPELDDAAMESVELPTLIAHRSSTFSHS